MLDQIFDVIGLLGDAVRRDKDEFDARIFGCPVIHGFLGPVVRAGHVVVGSSWHRVTDLERFCGRCIGGRCSSGCIVGRGGLLCCRNRLHGAAGEERQDHHQCERYGQHSFHFLPPENMGFPPL